MSAAGRTFSSMCDHEGRRVSADGAPAGRRQYRALCEGRGQQLLQPRDALALGRRGRIAGADDGTRALEQLRALVGLRHHDCERLDGTLTLQQQHEELVADQRLVLVDRQTQQIPAGGVERVGAALVQRALGRHHVEHGADPPLGSFAA